MVITTLRSTPCGRCGFSNGNSPAAMRSVQAANRDSALSGPMRDSVSAMLAWAWPDCVRRAQASAEFFDSAMISLGTVRTPLEPSAWHDWHEFFTVSIQ